MAVDIWSGFLQTLDISIIDRLLADDIARSDEDIKHGRVTSREDVLKELGLLRTS